MLAITESSCAETVINMLVNNVRKSILFKRLKFYVIHLVNKLFITVAKIANKITMPKLYCNLIFQENGSLWFVDDRSSIGVPSF